MEEQKLLHALTSSRKAWAQVRDWLEPEDFTAQGQVVLDRIEEFYKKDSRAKSCDLDILLSRITRALPNEKGAEPFAEILQRMREPISGKNIAEELLILKREAAAGRLANALAARSGQDHDEIDKLLTEYNALHQATCLEEAKELTLYAPDTVELFTEILGDKNRIKIHPPELNRRIGGGALRGHCVIVFGRVEMGKSLNAINAAAGFVSQGLRVLFVENEDTLADTKRRFTQRLIRRSRDWIVANPEKAAAMAKKKGIKRFLLTDSPTSARSLEAAVMAQEPDVLVVNQLRHMGKDGDVGTLDTLAKNVRNIGKKHNCLTYLITAAKEGETSNGDVREKTHLQIGDVYGSKTGIPGAADLLIGWGSSDSLKEQRMAVMSICKNKLVDNGGHGAFYVSVNPDTGFVYVESE